MSDGGTDQAPTLLAGYTRQRDDLLARIVGVLETDQRVHSCRCLSGPVLGHQPRPTALLDIGGVLSH